jgi:hypothetical protein
MRIRVISRYLRKYNIILSNIVEFSYFKATGNRKIAIRTNPKTMGLDNIDLVPRLRVFFNQGRYLNRVFYGN